MFRSAILSVLLLCVVAATDSSAATAGNPRFPNRKIMPGDHRPVYTRYGHHSLSRQGLFNLFRSNGSGIPKKVRFKKSRAYRNIK